MVAAATIPPVFPEEITASALPSRTNSTARKMEQSFFLRRPWTGLSSMVRTSEAGSISRRGSKQPVLFSSGSKTDGGPTT